MIIKNIEYPELLVEAIKNDKLVIFCGAGVSMSEPTKLPSFHELSEKIAELTNKEKRNDESDEQYLGRVENLDHDVHSKVCDILSATQTQPNKNHESLIDFFKKDIRIVTTNYDIMLESALEKKDRKSRIYSYPALPYGDKFNGIVHLHGAVENPQDIVLTDSDFGKSYMYHGNVTKFLRSLFESEYTVLFIGYSYNDIVMKYFTRSLPDLSGKKRYIFTSSDQASNYIPLGLTPIIHEKNNYKQIYDSLLRVSNLVTRDDNSWSLRIKDISEEVPNKINDEFDFEIKEILNNIHYSDKFFSKIKSRDWAEYLFNKGYFDEIFSINKVDDFGIQRIEWLSREIIINENDLFLKFCYDKDFILSKKLQIEIATIICNKNTKIENIEKLINLIDFNNLDFMLVGRLLDVCYKNTPKLDFVANEIYSSSLSFVLNKKIIISTDKIGIDFKFENYIMEELWNKYKFFKNKYYINILNNISNRLYNLKRYKIMGFNVEEFEFASFYPRPEEYISNLEQFLIIFKELLLGMDNKNKEYWYKTYISSDIPILLRSSLLILRHVSNVTGKEKLNLLKSNNIKILDVSLMEELFWLYADIFPALEDKDKKMFLDKIMNEEKLSENFNDKSYFYQKYNLLIWLQRFDESNKDIINKINSIKERYDYFKPRENPEKLIGPTTVRWGDAQLPYTETEIVNNLEKIIDKLLSYEGDGFERAERITLIRKLEEICSENENFRDKLIELLIKENELDTDFRRGIIMSLERSNLSEKKLIYTFDKVFFNPLVDIYNLEISRVIFSIVNTRKKISDKLVNFFYKKINLLWKYSSNTEEKSLDYMTRALYSSKGNLALSLIKLIEISVKNSEEKYLDDRFKDFLEQMLNEEVYNDSLVVILGNVSFFYSIDSEWCREFILDKYNTQDEELLNIAWTGFVNLSYLHTEFALVFEPIYHEAIKNINIFDENIRKKIFKGYISLIFNFSENPMKDYIPNIFRESMTEEILYLFYSELSLYIDNLDKFGKEEIFCKWIKDFLDRRSEGYPILASNQEKNLIIRFLVKFTDITINFDNILSRFDKEFFVEQSTLWFFTYYIEITKENADIINKIMIFVTDQMINNTQDLITNTAKVYLKDIFNKVSKVGVNTDKFKKNLEFMNVN
ncbi:SIR2 family protein [Anaerococcus sp. NML200574]|uniref:SIR2 family protein n=1 Tax=Anaerococcus sp. NML200574 TaxID=2954486 RepID=UPI0022370C13|nr:SIR2 family protein [Anaerococcus sp. NML200574]MCW6679258.1 SIR2 family protein [Anaerococcus sp. NML200574]